MNYQIIGQDGKTYGPVGAEQIRAWIAQGRIESRTPAFVEGGADWTFAGLLPEFAGNFSGVPPTIGSLKTGAAAPQKTNAFATWSLVCGCLAWACCCCCLPFNLLGLVFAIIALVQIDAQPETQTGRSLAIAGLILSATSWLGSFGWALLKLAANQPKFMPDFN